MNRFKGIIPAIISPAGAGGGLDLKPIPRLLDFFKRSGCEGVFVNGSSGEGFFLTPTERKRLAESVVRELAGEMPAVIHVGAMDIRVATDLARHAAKIKAAGVSSVMPFYYSYTLREARDYYQAIASASGLPLIIYVYSGAASITFTPETFVETMTTIKGLYGVKYTARTVDEMQVIRQLSREHLALFGGWDEIALPFLVMGARGLIGLNYNYMPEPFVALYKAFLRSDMAEAMRLQSGITSALHRLASVSPVARAKAGLHLRGLPVGLPRRPMRGPDPNGMAALKAALQQMGLGRITSGRSGPPCN